MTDTDESYLNGDTEGDFDAAHPAEIDAMIAMLDYLIPQARLVGASIVMHLLLARKELVISRSLQEKAIVKFSS
jgi:hypothetical protein